MQACRGENDRDFHDVSWARMIALRNSEKRKELFENSGQVHSFPQS